MSWKTGVDDIWSTVFNSRESSDRSSVCYSAEQCFVGTAKRVHATRAGNATMLKASHVFNETSFERMSRGGVREEHA